MRSDASRLRQRLSDLRRQQELQLDLLLAERGPLIRGSFGTRARVCGNPGCKCARGELHESKYLTATEQGKVRQVHVPASQEAHVAKGVARYRRFRRAQGQLWKLSKLQMELADQLGRSLLEAYPPSHPLPPASRRGRVPKERDDRGR